MARGGRDERRSPCRGRRLARLSVPWVLGCLSAISLRASAALAERLFRTPPRQGGPARRTGSFARGASHSFPRTSGRSRAWRCGRGRPVRSARPWMGRTRGRLSAFVAPLLEAGFSVVAFDALAHGNSTGKRLRCPTSPGAFMRWTPGGTVRCCDRAFDGRRRGGARDPGRWAVKRAVFRPAHGSGGIHAPVRAISPDPGRGSSAMKRRLESRYSTRWRVIS